MPTGVLVGVSLTDHLRSGLSGVYKFFEPEASRRSLGTFIILWHIEPRARAGPALRLSRLLDRREPQDGLQGPLRAAGAARRAAWRPLSSRPRADAGARDRPSRRLPGFT